MRENLTLMLTIGMFDSNETVCYIEEVKCPCLLDTGSMVTTVSAAFYNEHLSHMQLYPVDSIMEIKCANGISLIYLGYIEANVTFSPQDNVNPGLATLVLVVPDTIYNKPSP